MEHCIVCGAPYAEEHHVFEGWANRKISDKYHLTIPLCYEHHRGNQGIHKNKAMMNHYRVLGQKVYEEKIGTKEQFFADFGRYFTEE